MTTKLLFTSGYVSYHFSDISKREFNRYTKGIKEDEIETFHQKIDDGLFSSGCEFSPSISCWQLETLKLHWLHVFQNNHECTRPLPCLQKIRDTCIHPIHLRLKYLRTQLMLLFVFTMSFSNYFCLCFKQD